MWTAMESVQFQAGSAEIQSQCSDKIAKLAAWMQHDRNVIVGLDGHRDDARANDNDPVLSEKRVQAVRGALIAAGIAANRIVVGEFGARETICRGPVEDCLALSRRVDVHAARY